MAETERLRILVVIPSRLERAPAGQYFLEQGSRSIATQKPSRDIAGETARRGAAASVRFATAPVASQAAALNSAASLFDHDVIAFLEDGDLWSEQFLEV